MRRVNKYVDAALAFWYPNYKFKNAENKQKLDHAGSWYRDDNYRKR